jgi:hypothetical protein
MPYCSGGFFSPFDRTLPQVFFPKGLNQAGEDRYALQSGAAKSEYGGGWAAFADLAHLFFLLFDIRLNSAYLGRALLWCRINGCYLFFLTKVIKETEASSDNQLHNK